MRVGLRHVRTGPIIEYVSLCCVVMAVYRMRFNFHGVYISRILSFSDFRVLIFADGHVLSLHKSLI